MTGVSGKFFRIHILSAGLLLTFSSFGYAQVPPPPAPASPPPPAVTSSPPPQQQDFGNDNEDSRRRSALVSCCLRHGKGMGVFCSAGQLDRAVSVGDLIRRQNPDGSLFCAQGTGVLARQTTATGGGEQGQALASPFEPVHIHKTAKIGTAGRRDILIEILSGEGGRYRTQ